MISDKTIQPIAGGMKGFNTFPKGISPKVSVLARLKFEIACFKAVQHVSHKDTGTAH